MPIFPDPRKNQLLESLAEAELRRWQSHLEYVDMRLGEVLYESGDTLAHAYFPTTAIVLPAPRIAKWFLGGDCRRRQ